jgi:hypothetical protein
MSEAAPGTVLDLPAEQLDDFPRSRTIVGAAEHSRTQGA